LQDFVCPVCSELKQLEKMRKQQQEKIRKVEKERLRKARAAEAERLQNACSAEDGLTDNGNTGDGNAERKKQICGARTFTTKQWLALPPRSPPRVCAEESTLSAEQRAMHAQWVERRKKCLSGRVVKKKRKKKTGKPAIPSVSGGSNSLQLLQAVATANNLSPNSGLQPPQLSEIALDGILPNGDNTGGLNSDSQHQPALKSNMPVPASEEGSSASGNPSIQQLQSVLSAQSLFN
jgi:hypothetical protein